MDENPYRAPVEKGGQLGIAATKRFWLVAGMLVQLTCLAGTIFLCVWRFRNGLVDAWSLAIAVELGLIVVSFWSIRQQRT